MGESDALRPTDPCVVDSINKYNMAQVVNAASALQCTANIAILPVNHLTPPKASLLLDTVFDGAEKVYHAGGNNAEICRRERQQLQSNATIDEVITESIASNRLSLLFQPLVNLGASSGITTRRASTLKTG
jgi:predicted signal transduction protein with EAL and GGDEF domain